MPTRLPRHCKHPRCSETVTEGYWCGDHNQAYPAGLPRPECNVVVVAGPPAGGKSTYALENARPGDVVCDIDQIREDMPREAASGDVLRERNRALKEVAQSPPDGTLWFVTLAPKPEQRRFWQETLGARVVVLATSPATCKQRIRTQADRRSRRWGVAEQCAKVDEWWNLYRHRPGERVVRRSDAA